ncbi:MAG: metallophosphoesterase [Anaerolineae bacterium]|nr:metallophosphoesterase [Anaerolineae bacterium]
MKRLLTSVPITRRQFLQVGGALFSSLPVLYTTQVTAELVEVVELSVRIRSLPAALDKATLVQLSDIHVTPFLDLEYLRHVIALANAVSPDIVVLTGDYVTGNATYSKVAARELARLQARYGVYAILGNHEIWTDPDVITANLEAVGITVLRNARAAVCVEDKVRKSAGVLWLLGLDDQGTGVCKDFTLFRAIWERQRQVLADLLASIPEDEPRVLLIHNPDFVAMLPDARLDLMLAGHTHGGTINVSLIGLTLSPSCFGQTYMAGLTQVGATQLYVNRGIGGFKVRINARPEVTVMKLVAA